MKLIVINLFVALFIWKGQAGTFTVKYTCDGLTLSFNAYEANGKLKVVYAASKDTSCGSNTNAGANPKVVFTVPSGGATAAAPATGTISDSAADISACGYTGDTTSRSVTLHLLQNQDIVNNGDGKTTLTCASSDTTTAEKTAQITGITGALNDVPATKDIHGLTLAVIDGNTVDGDLHNAGLPNTITLATTTLRIIARLAARSPSNVLIQTCTAVPSSATTPIIKIITTSCPDTRDGVYDAFTGRQTPYIYTAARPHLYTIRTPAFRAFRIRDKTSIDIKCTVLFCASGIGCAPPRRCSADGRRRRDADPTQGLRNQTMTTTIYIGTNPRNQDTSARAQDISMGDCLSHVSFISVVAILAVLLVVSLAVSVFFCSKLIRQNNNSQKKEAYPNPAYKA